MGEAEEHGRRMALECGLGDRLAAGVCQRERSAVRGFAGSTRKPAVSRPACHRGNEDKQDSEDGADGILHWITIRVCSEAPGEGVLTTYLDNRYDVIGGNSFAAPLVAGSVALLYSIPQDSLCKLSKKQPLAALNNVKDAILRGVDIVPSLQGKTITGGRLNVSKAYEQLRRNFGQPIGDYDILKLWTNPANKQISVVFQLPENVSAKIVIVNALGQIVYQRPINDADLLSEKTTIDANPLFPGLYYLSVFTNNFRVTKKFVVVH